MSTLHNFIVHTEFPAGWTIKNNAKGDAVELSTVIQLQLDTGEVLDIEPTVCVPLSGDRPYHIPHFPSGAFWVDHSRTTRIKQGISCKLAGDFIYYPQSFDFAVHAKDIETMALDVIANTK